jgi:hypothetical protein
LYLEHPLALCSFAELTIQSVSVIVSSLSLCPSSMLSPFSLAEVSTYIWIICYLLIQSLLDLTESQVVLELKMLCQERVALREIFYRYEREQIVIDDDANLLEQL